jgi:hypothetical protein
MKLMKVFDCTDMPDNIRKAFFKAMEGGNSVGNDVYVDWYNLEEHEYLIKDLENKDFDLYGEEHISNAVLVNTWLLENGANIGEEVIIKHWW